MKSSKQALFFVLFVILSIPCMAGGGSAKSSAPAAPQAATPAPVVPSWTPSSQFFDGDGGRGMSLGILLPEGQGLSADQNYLPSMVQGVLVSNISKYSAISVLDRVSLDKVLAETLDGTYEENFDIVRIGHVAQVGSMLTGKIIRTSTGYTLQLNVTDTTQAKTLASYSGTCTAAQFDDFSAINLASKDLLTQMGVQLTDTAVNELGKSSSVQSINAQTNLAQGIVAQQRGTVIEAMSYFYNAVAFDSGLSEANGRLSTLSSPVKSGNIGENVRNDIQRRNEWVKLLAEAMDYFAEHPPFEIEYQNYLTQGRIDYAKETVVLETEVSLNLSNSFQIITDIRAGLRRTRQSEEWGFGEIHERSGAVPGGWPFAYHDNGILDKKPRIVSVYVREPNNSSFNAYRRQMRVDVVLLNEIGKIIATGEATNNSRDVNVYISYIFPTEWGWNAPSKIRFLVNANDITDNMTIKIVKVDGVDVEKNPDYIRITAKQG